MDFFFPKFIRASYESGEAFPSRKSLFQCVLEEGPRGYTQENDTHSRRLTNVKPGEDDASENDSALSANSSAAREDDKNVLTAVHSTWSVPQYILHFFAKKSLKEAFFDFHSISATKRCPAPIFSLGDIGLPIDLVRKIEEGITRGWPVDPMGRGKFQGKRGRRGDMRYNDLVATLTGGDSYLDQLQNLVLLGPENTIASSETVLKSEMLPNELLPTQESKVLQLWGIQQCALSSLLLGHHTVLTAPKGCGKRTAVLIAVACNLLSSSIPESSELKVPPPDLEASPRLDPDSSSSPHPPQNRNGDGESEAAGAPGSSSQSIHPQAIIVTHSLNMIKITQWLSNIFGMENFSFFTFKRGTISLVPISLWAGPPQNFFPGDEPQSQAPFVPPFPNDETTPFVGEPTFDEPDPTEPVYPVRSDSYERDRKVRDRSHKRRVSAKPDRKRHRSHSRRRRGRSRDRSHRDARCSRHRHSRNRHDSHRRRRRHCHDRDQHDHHRHHPRPHRRSREPSSKPEKRRKVDGEAGNKLQNDPSKREGSLHRSNRPHELNPKIIEQTNFTPDVLRHNDKATTIFHEISLTGIPPESAANFTVPSSSLDKRIPILILPSNTFFEALQVIQGDASLLPFERVRHVCFLDAERLLNRYIRETIPNQYWVNLVNSVDVECQFIFSAQRLHAALRDFVLNTLLQDSVDHFFAYEQIDESIWFWVAPQLVEVHVSKSDRIESSEKAKPSGNGEEEISTRRVSFEEIDASKVVAASELILNHFASREVTPTVDGGSSSWQSPCVVVYTWTKKEQIDVAQNLAFALRENRADVRGSLLRVTTQTDEFKQGRADILVISDSQLFDSREWEDGCGCKSVELVIHFSLSKDVLHNLSATHSSPAVLLDLLSLRARTVLGPTDDLTERFSPFQKMKDIFPDKVQREGQTHSKTSLPHFKCFVLITHYHMKGRVGSRMKDILMQLSDLYGHPEEKLIL